MRTPGTDVRHLRARSGQLLSESAPDGLLVVWPQGAIRGPARWMTSTGRVELHEVTGGIASVLPPEMPRWGEVVEGGDIHELCLSRELLDELAPRWETWLAPDPISRDPHLLALGREVGALLSGPPAVDRPLLLDTLAVELVERLRGAPSRTPHGARHPSLARSVERMREAAHRGASVRIRVLADEAQLSRAHFITAFRRWTGLTPARFLLRLRAHEAYARLATDASLGEIAAAVGFADHAHMARTLRRLFGASPSRLRARDRTLVQASARPSE